LIGQTISHYTILEKLGSGGMGEVWKAEDEQLRRTVALKFLAQETLGDAEIPARLIREAQAAASLDHPNICAVHGIHEEDGKTFIVMAYIDGPALADKIKERPLPLGEALGFAVQIAEGLQEAHEKGIVHRDVKPQNVMLTAKGQVKVMDFGLASLAGRSKLTKSGTTLGTPAYMAPEQLEAGEVDRRADIWALGCVLYEMLTQRTPFEAEYEQAIAYGILNEQPEPVTALRSGLPTEIDRLIAKALSKDAAERYQHADDMIVDLNSLNKKQAAAPPAIPQTQSRGTAPNATVGPPRAVHGSLQRTWPMVLSAVLALAVVLLVLQGAPEAAPPEPGPLRRFALKVGEDPASNIRISPDGRHIAYVTRPSGAEQLWIWDLDREEPRRIETAIGAHSPSWSSGSDFLAFGQSSEMKVVAVDGGPATTLCTIAGVVLHGTWSPDGKTIVFALRASQGVVRLYEVPAQGGAPKLLFEPEGLEQDKMFMFPQFLPLEGGRRGLIFAKGTNPDEAQIELLDLETGRRDVLVAGTRPFYSPTGHIVFERRPRLWAVPFSVERLTTTGEPFPIDKHAAAIPSVARDGTLVYTRGASTNRRQLTWRGRDGGKLGVIGLPQAGAVMPVLSPDDGQVAVRAYENDNFDIFVHEVAGGLKRRITFDSVEDDRPGWTHDGERVTYSSTFEGSIDVFTRSADGRGKVTALLAKPENEYLYGWSSDGKYAVGTSGNQIWYLRANEAGNEYEKSFFIANEFDATSPDLSPDARFLAYESNESGRYEVRVQPFPEGGGIIQISTNGGGQPRWSGDGKEIFYVEGDTMMAVAVNSGSSFSAGKPERLFDGGGAFRGRGQRYDVAADGQRFVVAELVEAAPEPTIHVVLNWYEEFRESRRD